MKDIYQKFLSKCSKSNQDIIQKYIDISIEENNKGRYWGSKSHTSLLSEKLGLNFSNGIENIVENNFEITIGANGVTFYSMKPFLNKYVFSTSINLEIKENIENEYQLILRITDKNFESILEVAINSDLDNNFFIESIEEDPEINIKSNINWRDKNVVDFILQNYCTPENIKNLSGIVCDLDFEKDELIKVIYKNAQLLDKKTSSKKRNSLK